MKYINQVRTVQENEKPGNWEDACGGHDTYEKALCCSLAHQQLLTGEPVNDKLVNAAEQRGIAILGAVYKALDIALEMRIVRRTITDEVIDA